MASSNILRLKPLQYAHILNLNTNVVMLKVGPLTHVLQDNELLQEGPVPHVKVPPGHYCVICNPVKLPIKESGICELQFGQQEMRFFQEPFPLYPGEILLDGTAQDPKKAIKTLPVVKPKHGLRLKALIDHVDGKIKRTAGEEWQIEGPCTYFPCPEVEVTELVKPHVIHHEQALRVRALQDITDKNGRRRVTGEEWLIREPGAYLLDVYEQFVGLETGDTLTENVALHLKAIDNCVDALGRKRIAGEEWLVTVNDTSHYIPEVLEKVASEVHRTVLNAHEFCVVVSPVDKNGKPQLGKRELRTGITSFFLKPGESLERGIENAYILEEDEALVLCAREAFADTFNLKAPVQRKSGDKWMIFGPIEYVPPVEVIVKDRRRAIPLAENEGVYVQDTTTGRIRTEMGPQSFLLREHEVLWKKQLSETLELLLRNGGCYGEGDIRKLSYFESSVDPTLVQGHRDKTKVVTWRCPGTCAVQVFDYNRKTSRVVFGPDLVLLGPHEIFNVLSLSAGKPKRPNALKSLGLMLGPDFITDIIEVETLDHAKLRIKYAVNNKFEYQKGNTASELKIFSVPDFIGFVCNMNSSRIRGRVAKSAFDEFHRYSTLIVKEAIFGLDEEKKIRNVVRFEENNLVVTNVDVQSIEPVDPGMRDSLQKSIQLAIEIATSSIERAASHEAKQAEQIARGKLERNKLDNEKAAEEARRELFELRAITAAVESSGQAKAEAQAKAERLLIEGKSEIEAAKLKAEAEDIVEGAKLFILKKTRTAEIDYDHELNRFDIQKSKALASIELSKFAGITSAIGPDAMSALASAGPDTRNKILSGLRLKTSIFTDENSPLSLFQSGMLSIQ